MLLVTTEQIAGRNVEPLGIVEGSSIQTVHAGKDIMNSLKTLVGGELTSYTEMMEKARKNIKLEQEQAKSELQSQIADIAMLAARKIIKTGEVHDTGSNE